MSKQSAQDIADAFENAALLVGSMAKVAGDIAHARRTLYNAYLAEGFTEAQALELCKALLLT